MHPSLDPLLQAMMEERLQPGADIAAIDARIWEAYGEEWCIMATDLSGFSRGVAERGIVHFLQTIYESERLLVPIVESFGGIVLKVEGDSFLAIFREPQQGLDAALAMQDAVRLYNRRKSDSDQVLLGIGLGFGRILRVAEAEVYGVEVNSACVLGETYARPYEIIVTRAVAERAREDMRFESFAHVPPGAGSAHRVLYG
jgi:adenylate cyclase